VAFDLYELRQGIRPFRLHWFPRLRSTNDHARAMRQAANLFAPAIVLTGHQLAGRGRGSNSWWSGAGSLTVTFVLPAETHLQAHQVPLVAGLAVRDAAAELAANDNISLKWPNDLLMDGRKLAGLLCERVDKADLVGLGMNLNVNSKHVPKALQQKITSLHDLTGGLVDETSALIVIARHLYEALSRRGERPFAETLGRYDAHHYLINRRVTIINSDAEPAVSGIVQGLDDIGRLVLKTRSGTQRIIAGQVQLDHFTPCRA
jgi:BirA family biotin operon repressor/biotin-[acetyl-CoA-carboxylase] ligase